MARRYLLHARRLSHLQLLRRAGRVLAVAAIGAAAAAVFLAATGADPADVRLIVAAALGIGVLALVTTGLLTVGALGRFGDHGEAQGNPREDDA